MSESVRKSNPGIDELEAARKLRREAEALEHKSRVRAWLRQLMEVSEDPEYDRYLEQMMKDLESERATPQQVEEEARRSYYLYRERMAARGQRHFVPQRTVPAPVRAASADGNPARFSEGQGTLKTKEKMESVSVEVNSRKYEQIRQADGLAGEHESLSKIDRNMEYKVGIHVFSIIGAVFVLIAFAIFGFHFLNGMVQGLCLYGAALALVILSETILLKKQKRQNADEDHLQEETSQKMPPGRSYKFLHVITGIGIGGLYAANLINYFALGTISALGAMTITLLIAAGALFLDRKKDSTVIRIISLMGCYICFLPIWGTRTEADFLIISAMMFLINIWNIFVENRKEQTAADIVHLALNLIFTFIFISTGSGEKISVIYRVLYIVTAFAFANILSLKKCISGNTLLFTLSCVVNGIYIFLFFLLGNMPEMLERPEAALFVHLTVAALIASICGVIALLWPGESSRRWSQLYYVVGAVLILGSFSEYTLEVVLSLLILLLITKAFAGHWEVSTLDCIVTFWIGMRCFLKPDSWEYWLLMVALVVSAVGIKHMHLYHEIVITTSVLLMLWSQCVFYRYGLNPDWLCPVSAGILLFLFLYFNHLPGLKDMDQKIYNRINVSFMLLYYLGVWFCQSYVISSVMMALGAVTIIIVFQKRYQMELKRKYFILMGFLTYFTLTGHYKSPVIVSILLMVISLLGVGIGFRLSDKEERICGLVMAGFVCLKLVVYDFREVEAVYRMIVFLAVGILALLISYIYVKLEKRNNDV